MGQNPTEDEINEMMRQIDLNQEELIDFDKFMILMTKYRQILKQKKK